MSPVMTGLWATYRQVSRYLPAGHQDDLLAAIEDVAAHVEQLERRAKEQADYDAEYLRWSLSPDRLTDALALGAALARGERR